TGNLRELLDVLALVAALGRILAASRRFDGGAKEVDLPTCVVPVVLARDRVAGELEQPRDAVAVRAVAGRCNGERPGRVGADHLHLDALIERSETATVPLVDSGELPGEERV